MKEDYKDWRGITILASPSECNLTVSASSPSKSWQILSLQLDIASSMKDLGRKSGRFEILPSNVGLKSDNYNSE